MIYLMQRRGTNKLVFLRNHSTWGIIMDITNKEINKEKKREKKQYSCQPIALTWTTTWDRVLRGDILLY